MERHDVNGKTGVRNDAIGTPRFIIERKNLGTVGFSLFWVVTSVALFNTIINSTIRYAYLGALGRQRRRRGPGHANRSAFGGTNDWLPAVTGRWSLADERMSE